MKVLIFLMLCFASVTLADDFRTIDGKEYKNVTVRRVEPDGIVLTTSAGISKVYFIELPKDVQERFHYDQTKAAQFTTTTVQTQQTIAAAQRASIAETQRTEAAAKIRAEIDRLKLYMMDGQISQVMRDGVILRGPTWEQNGSPVAWINCLLVGEFPGAVDGATWTGWMWPAGTYTGGVQTIQRYATTLDAAWQLQIKEAAGRLQKH